ncbi:MAG: class I SAM-dependent methyltransferase [Pseudomonadota bacterium]|nr:class I SAM-dependent methyltransferase [Pseudomonadota bacterium]
MQSLPFWVHAPYHAQALDWQARLADQSIQLAVEQHAEPLRAKDLRAAPELALLLDQQGLWLAADGMRMQPDWLGQLPRLKRATIKTELAARACQIETQPQLIDATAGLGHDGLLLARLGASVILVERHPIVWALLQSAIEQAQVNPHLAKISQRMQVVLADAVTWLPHQSVDVVYLDPMFPKGEKPDKKQPQVKKEMQILQRLFAASVDDGAALLVPARQAAPRVIVKRPKLAPVLADQPPDHQWLGDACRFDGYFQPHSATQELA